jgi:tetratricopeptide (TPR) repeat protein
MKTRMILVITLVFSSMSMYFSQAASARTIQFTHQSQKKLQAQICRAPSIPRSEALNTMCRSYDQQQREAEAWARNPQNPENQDPEIRGLDQLERYFFYVERGREKNKKNDITGALSDYNKAIYFYPDSTLAYHQRGVVKTRLNDFSGALADYNLSIKLERKPVERAMTFNNRGLLKQMHLNDREGGIQDLREAARLFKQKGDTVNHQEVLDHLRKMNATL